MIEHYYHIYADGNWSPAVTEHLEMLINSGLIQELSVFGVGIVGTPENRLEAATYLKNFGLPVSPTIIVEADKGYEQVTLDVVYQRTVDAVSNGENPYILYAHTKGASDSSAINVCWRWDMTQHTVGRWAECIEWIDKGYDVVGIFWANAPHSYFAGTFWWSTAEFLSKLGLPLRDTRWGAESWHRDGTGGEFSYKILPKAPTWPYVHQLPENRSGLVPLGYARFIATGKILQYRRGPVYMEPETPLLKAILDKGVHLVRF